MEVPVGGGLSQTPSRPMAFPLPKSPPEYPDLYGRRREIAKVQMLEREIGFLEAELKSVEGLQPASRSCKEVSDSVIANSDPLIHTRRKHRRSCGFWNWLCGIPFLNLASFCCCCRSKCSCRLKRPMCFNCSSCSGCCPKPSCPVCCCCCGDTSCSANCNCCSFGCPSCNCSCFRCLSCSGSSCCGCKCSSPCFKFPKVRLCCNCRNLCCA